MGLMVSQDATTYIELAKYLLEHSSNFDLLLLCRWSLARKMHPGARNPTSLNFGKFEFDDSHFGTESMFSF